MQTYMTTDEKLDLILKRLSFLEEQVAMLRFDRFDDEKSRKRTKLAEVWSNFTSAKRNGEVPEREVRYIESELDILKKELED